VFLLFCGGGNFCGGLCFVFRFLGCGVFVGGGGWVCVLCQGVGGCVFCLLGWVCFVLVVNFVCVGGGCWVGEQRGLRCFCSCFPGLGGLAVPSG